MADQLITYDQPTIIKNELIKPILGTPLNTEHPLAKGLIGSWLFNEKSGIVLHDSSGSNNHARINSPANLLWVLGGVDSDQTNGACAPLDKQLDLYQAMSIFAIVKFESDNVDMGIAGSGGGNRWMFWQDSTTVDTIAMAINDGSFKVYYGTTEVPNNEIITCGAIYTGLNTYVYLNGKDDTKTTGTQIMNAGVEDVRLFAGSTDTDKEMNGVIYCVYIWDRAITEADMAFLHSDPYCMFEQPGYFPYVEAVGGGLTLPIARRRGR